MPVDPVQWLNQLDAVVDRLQQQGQNVVVGGLSLGAILALQVARRRPSIQGVITYSPPIISADPRALIAPLLAKVLASVPRPADDFVDPTTAERIWTYNRWPSRCSVKVLELIADTRRHLAEVRQPLLVMASRLDRVITVRGLNNGSYRHRRASAGEPSADVGTVEVVDGVVNVMLRGSSVNWLIEE